MNGRRFVSRDGDLEENDARESGGAIEDEPAGCCARTPGEVRRSRKGLCGS